MCRNGLHNPPVIRNALITKNLTGTNESMCIKATICSNGCSDHMGVVQNKKVNVSDAIKHNKVQ